MDDKKMTYYFTSDTHFGHKNIIEYCKRPFKTIDEMNDTITKNWNEVVKEDDTVYHLGDFSFRGFHTYRNKLNGSIILLKGNHDSDAHSVIKELTIKFGGKEWYLTHIPPLENRKQFCLCGHIHERWKSKKLGNKFLINVGVDVWNFKPITIQQILSEVNRLKLIK